MGGGGGRGDLCGIVLWYIHYFLFIFFYFLFFVHMCIYINSIYILYFCIHVYSLGEVGGRGSLSMVIGIARGEGGGRREGEQVPRFIYYLFTHLSLY